MTREETLSAHPGVVVIRPTRGWAALNLVDLWRYRELVYFLTWRDIKVRYKQTLLGAAWAILSPVFTMVLFTIFFGRMAGVDTGGVPYPIFSYTALLPWTLFAKAINDAGRTLINNRNMITKVYFPRLTMPLSTVLAGLVDFAIAFLVLIGLMVYYQFFAADSYRFHLGWSLATLPLFLLLAILTALGAGLWLSALNVNYRDVNYLLPHITQFWLFLTPIAYPSELVTGTWRIVYSLNPMAGVVEGFRWALAGTRPPDPLMLAISAGVTLVLLVSGLFYFRRMERTFADEI